MDERASTIKAEARRIVNCSEPTLLERAINFLVEGQ
jgi:hypothetical protein